MFQLLISTLQNNFTVQLSVISICQQLVPILSIVATTSSKAHQVGRNPYFLEISIFKLSLYRFFHLFSTTLFTNHIRFSFEFSSRFQICSYFYKFLILRSHSGLIFLPIPFKNQVIKISEPII